MASQAVTARQEAAQAISTSEGSDLGDVARVADAPGAVAVLESIDKTADIDERSHAHEREGQASQAALQQDSQGDDTAQSPPEMTTADNTDPAVADTFAFDANLVRLQTLCKYTCKNMWPAPGSGRCLARVAALVAQHGSNCKSYLCKSYLLSAWHSSCIHACTPVTSSSTGSMYIALAPPPPHDTEYGTARHMRAASPGRRARSHRPTRNIPV